MGQEFSLAPFLQLPQSMPEAKSQEAKNRGGSERRIREEDTVREEEEEKNDKQESPVTP